jgi:hypothetical protein
VPGALAAACGRHRFGRSHVTPRINVRRHATKTRRSLCTKSAYARGWRVDVCERAPHRVGRGRVTPHGQRLAARHEDTKTRRSLCTRRFSASCLRVFVAARDLTTSNFLDAATMPCERQALLYKTAWCLRVFVAARDLRTPPPCPARGWRSVQNGFVPSCLRGGSRFHNEQFLDAATMPCERLAHLCKTASCLRVFVAARDLTTSNCRDPAPCPARGGGSIGGEDAKKHLYKTASCLRVFVAARDLTTSNSPDAATMPCATGIVVASIDAGPFRFSVTH